MKRIMKSLLTATVLTVMVLAMGVMVSAATTQTPGKVTGLKQTDAYTSSVDIEWDAQLVDCTYVVEISEDGKNWVSQSDTYSTSKYLYNLSTGKTYYVRVRANSGSSSSPKYGPYSDTLAVVTEPAEIKSVYQTSATTSSITIGWSKAEGATSYQIYQYVNGVYLLKGETSNTSYTFSGLKNTQSFAFSSIRVDAVRSAGTFKAARYGTSLSNYSLRLIPKKVSNVTIRAYYKSLKEISLGFDQTLYADGYQYQLYDLNGKKAISTSVTSSYYSTYIKNLKLNRFYKVRVRAYATINGKNVYGAWSDYKAFAFQPEVKLKSSGRNVKLSWKKVKGAKNYTVYMSTSQKSGYKKVKTLKKTSYKATKFKKKKLSKKKTYYFYVVANTKLGKKKVKSDVELCYWITRY